MRLDEFSDRVTRRIARLAAAQVVPAMGIPRAPLSHGAAGVAFFLAERARGLTGASRRSAADRARAWIEAAEHTLRHPRTACGFRGSAWRDEFGGLGAFHGRAGVHVVAARVAEVRGDRTELRAAVGRFLRTWKAARERADLPTEVFLGFAGFLHATRELRRHAEDIGPELAARVLAVGDEAHERVMTALARRARRRFPQGMLLGYAHGLVGELDAVLAHDPRPSPVVETLLDRLLAAARVEDDLVAWPAQAGLDAVGVWWPSWCNGVAGHVYLWCRAYEVFRLPRYLRAARRAAGTTALLHNENPTVCCGTAGQALALARHARLSGEASDRRRATRYAQRACEQALAIPGMHLTYFGGLSGIAHLALALHRRSTPRMPLVDADAASGPPGQD